MRKTKNLDKQQQRSGAGRVDSDVGRRSDAVWFPPPSFMEQSEEMFGVTCSRDHTSQRRMILPCFKPLLAIHLARTFF